MTSGIMYGDNSNHLPIFVIAPIKLSKNVKNINDAKFIRDMSNFIINKFNNDLTERLYQLNMSDKISDQEIFLNIVNKHAPLKKASRHEKS